MGQNHSLLGNREGLLITTLLTQVLLGIVKPLNRLSNEQTFTYLITDKKVILIHCTHLKMVTSKLPGQKYLNKWGCIRYRQLFTVSTFCRLPLFTVHNGVYLKYQFETDKTFCFLFCFLLPKKIIWFYIPLDKCFNYIFQACIL